MNIILTIILALRFLLPAQDTEVIISGYVTDFDGHPIDSCYVELKDRNFGTVASAYTDASGCYSIRVPSGTYIALLAVRKDEYAVTKLEYWAWNIYAYSDIEINPRYDKLELYAVNVFKPQGAYPSYFIYFRPMGLSRIYEFGPEKLYETGYLDIAPDLTKEDIQVVINGQEVEIFSVQYVIEYADQQTIGAYLIQTGLSDTPPSYDTFDIIRITVADPVYGDRGEALYIFDRGKYR